MNSAVNYKEQSDETLVALTLMRDEAAFEELVIRHRRAALLIAKTVTRNIHTAEDAVQDAFLCAWQRLDTLQDAAKFGHWVCRIAKYRAVNLAKRYRDYIPFDEVENYLAEFTWKRHIKQKGADPFLSLCFLVGATDWHQVAQRFPELTF